MPFYVVLAGGHQTHAVSGWLSFRTTALWVAFLFVSLLCVMLTYRAIEENSLLVGVMYVEKTSMKC